jgi:cardiolipin synthase
VSASPIVTTRVEGGDGLQTARESASVLREVRDEGRGRQFENHLAILQQAGETLSAGNDVQLLVDGPATFDAMFADLERARRRILLESYIFDGELIGRRMADLLLKKRGEGLEVRLIFDSVGSFDTPAAFFDELRAGGVAVCEFNPVSPLRRATGILQLNHRDHRKVLVVDDRIAFTGGLNVSSVYSSSSFGSRRNKGASPDEDGWRDTHVRIEGPAVREFIERFDDTWRRQGCAGEAGALPEVDAGEIRPAEQGERLVAVIDSAADADTARFYRALLAAIEGATDSIHITMAYFAPDPQLVAGLKRAAARGVEVVLVLPGHTDSTLVLRAGQSHYADLLAAGVRIRERHDAFLHAKTAVIDGVWSTVGSSNLDWRSFLHNDELNVVILGREFGAAMERLFVRDLDQAEEIEAEAWGRRGAGRRLMEWLARLWEYWL